MGEKNLDLTKHFPPLMCALVQPGLRYIQLSRMDRGRLEGETMLSSQHHPAGRISQGPRVTGPEAILTQLPILIRASDGNKQARGISQGPWLPILILICAKKIWLSLESNVSHNYHRHH